MSQQFTGEMLLGLMLLVEKVTASPNARFRNSSAEDAELERLRVLLCSGEETALKAAMTNLIDRLKSANPDPAEVTAAMEEVKRLWPETAATGV